ncbi:MULTISPECIES: immune inhibitor A domain-containing protein [unclassified Nocardioides]|uniref:immune inhibitor A domain-containing protein n=1 Tax=unclassified Nocardioides TaxID=2615069 RepID=UPI001910E42F|nr:MULTISPECIES: immune inhibitor A domain-containing protein [unclassified Nocardioides]
MRAAAVVSTLALAAVALAGTGGPGATSAAPANAPTGASASDDVYINYVAPRADRSVADDVKIDKKTGKISTKKYGSDALARAYEVDRKNARGNPVTARQLARLEAKALKTGKSPKAIKGSKTQQTAKLLTILVDFNPAANDDFTGVMVPETVFESRTCVAGDVQNGPVHNNIPNPANASHPDNNSMWVPDFSSQHYNNMLYTKTGITQRVRTDLTGPDGQPGFDISGYTMKNMYEEMSKGAYTVSGSATPWVQVPHSEAWYSASRCYLDNGVWTAPIPQANSGHPDNPGGVQTMAKDAINTLAATQPNFPWADYDLEDQGDIDGDGNVLEPDGVVDHLVLVHAGEDKSGGGGAQGIYSIWAHSSTVVPGYDIPGTDMKVANYIVQPEDSGVGVFAHEYGHDLGLPDLYDISGAGESDIDFWDLMSSGSHSGPIFQSLPTHMGLWDKWVLGWADPLQLNPGDPERDVIVGQTSRTPKGTKDGVKVNLPPKVITLAQPHSGDSMWYTDADQAWADNRLTRDIAVPNNADARFNVWNNYVLEEDWDYGFVEVSTDGGTTWSEQKVYTGDDVEVSTPDGYSDPNGRMHDFGDKLYGLTGDSEGWRLDYVKLGAFAGQNIKLRLRVTTDEAFQERGWFADDFSVTGGGATTWSDDAETDGDWTATVGSFTDTTGAGWHRDSGTSTRTQYYLIEWRNYDGFDKGLQYAYDSSYSHDAWKVEKIKYNAPGMLVWYRDTTYDNYNAITANTTALPSAGSKGGLLLVDSHYDPFRRTGVAAEKDPSTLNNMPGRPQSSNIAFGLVPTKPFRECFELLPAEPFSEYCTDIAAQAPVSTFTDERTWYPGIEIRGSSVFFRDIDASVVVPSAGNAPYSTRVVDANGNPLPAYYGLDLGINSLLGTGNPDDEGVSFHTKFQVLEVKSGNTAAKIHIVPPTP